MLAAHVAEAGPDVGVLVQHSHEVIVALDDLRGLGEVTRRVAPDEVLVGRQAGEDAVHDADDGVRHDEVRLLAVELGHGLEALEGRAGGQVRDVTGVLRMQVVGGELVGGGT